MADTITEALKELIEGGMGEAGYYPAVNGVRIGEPGDVVSGDKYPLIMIVEGEDAYHNNGNHITVQRNYNLVIHVIDSDVLGAEKARDLILLDEFSNPVKGLIPFFLVNNSVSIDSVEYDIEMLTTMAASGKDYKGRTTAAATLPLRLERIFTI